MKKDHRPVYVISGFLGAGKTTLLNRLLKENHGRKFAVIVNEFGEIGLDGSLLEGTQDFVKMDNGCLCCALNADLVETLENLKDRDDFDAVVLETTGVADPLPVAWTFFREQFEKSFRFGGIVTVVDALNFEKMNQEAMEVVLQIERADYIYLSKTKLVDGKKLGALKQLISEELNPNARQILDTDPDWLDLLFDFYSDLELKGEVHEHHQHDHGSAFSSIAISLKDKKMTLDQMEDCFEALPKQVFRAKAAFQDSQSRKHYIIHSVCGRVEFYEKEEGVSEPVAIFIGKGFDEKLVKESLVF